MTNNGLTLSKVQFKNFRSLRDIELNFSTDPEKPLTVIRAENESGKTTMIRALTWAFFGDGSLPNRRAGFRISPIDWDTDSDGPEVEIEVEVYFEAGGSEYMLKRHCIESLSLDAETNTIVIAPSASQLVLLEKVDSGGWDPIDNPEAVLEAQVPTAIQDIFFIDGDKALVWIESNDARAVQRTRIEEALRSLLGLKLLENAEDHVEAALSRVIRQISAAGGGTELSQLTEQAETLEGEIKGIEESLVERRESKKAFETSSQEASKALEAALKAGGGEKEQLQKALDDNRDLTKGLEAQIQHLTEQHRRYLEAPGMPACLASDALEKAIALLGKLERAGDIPDTLPDIIQDRLTKGRCICGEELHEGSEKYEFLQNALDENEGKRESVRILAALNTSLQGAGNLNIASTWNRGLFESHKQINERKESLDRANRQHGELQTKIARIPDTDIEQLRTHLATQQGLLSEINLGIAKKTQRQEDLKERRAEIVSKITELARGQEQLRKQLATKEAGEDVKAVVTSTLDELKQVKLKEVSKEMNDLFLSMIGADTDSVERPRAIHGAELTDEHDIVVYGANNSLLNPDIDLNGASRRALTLAFILALTKVSGEKAPNIVDTPLGMTSGGVRFDFLKQVLTNSHQSVMFLTRAEIQGVEDLIDIHAGEQVTVTAAWHYPEYLENYPGTDRIQSIRCDCDIRSDCDICKRVPEGLEVEGG